MVPTGFPDSVSIVHAEMVWSFVRSIAWLSSMGYSKLRQLEDVYHVMSQVTIFYQQGMVQSLLARVGFNNKWSVVIKSLQWWNMIVFYLSCSYSRSESQVYIDFSLLQTPFLKWNKIVPTLIIWTMWSEIAEMVRGDIVMVRNHQLSNQISKMTTFWRSWAKSFFTVTSPTSRESDSFWSTNEWHLHSAIFHVKSFFSFQSSFSSRLQMRYLVVPVATS